MDSSLLYISHLPSQPSVAEEGVLTNLGVKEGDRRIDRLEE